MGYIPQDGAPTHPRTPVLLRPPHARPLHQAIPAPCLPPRVRVIHPQTDCGVCSGLRILVIGQSIQHHNIHFHWYHSSTAVVCCPSTSIQTKSCSGGKRWSPSHSTTTPHCPWWCCWWWFLNPCERTHHHHYRRAYPPQEGAC